MQIRMLEDLAAQAPVVNAGRVEELRQAIAEGRLKVDSEAIAGKLLATVHELAQRGRSK
jgi:flagellar biosynthesis anti-sigma factor FlgM